jgi:hypothetical protein
MWLPFPYNLYANSCPDQSFEETQRQILVGSAPRLAYSSIDSRDFWLWHESTIVGRYSHVVSFTCTIGLPGVDLRVCIDLWPAREYASHGFVRWFEILRLSQILG